MKESNKNESYEKLEATVGMALTDFIPVVLFIVAVYLLGVTINNPVFWIGAILASLSGLLKAVWKLIKAIWKKNFTILTAQFKYSMSAGFLAMIIGYIIARKNLNIFELRSIVAYPFTLVNLILCVLGMVAMIICGAKLDFSKKKNNWIEEGINIAAQFFFMMAAVVIWYGMSFYPADANALQALQSNETVKVSLTDNGYFFDGPGEERALIMYPGGLVEYTAYAPLMQELAQNGVDCFLVHFPMCMAFADMDAAEPILDKYSYNEWYLAGHSLGGAMGAVYVANNIDRFNGILLLGSYSTKSLDGGSKKFTAVSIYGSNDGVLSLDKVKENRKNMPGNYREYVIEGGNHGNFGSYGFQKGDKASTITASQQIKETVKVFLDTVNAGTN